VFGLGGIRGDNAFVLGEFARRLGKLRIDTVAVSHDDFEDGTFIVSVAGFGRDERGCKMFYGFSMWNDGDGVRMTAFTCGLKQNSGVKELIVMATEPYVPHVELPVWVALALHKRSVFELFDVRKKILNEPELWTKTP